MYHQYRQLAFHKSWSRQTSTPRGKCKYKQTQKRYFPIIIKRNISVCNYTLDLVDNLLGFNQIRRLWILTRNLMNNMYGNNTETFMCNTLLCSLGILMCLTFAEILWAKYLPAAYVKAYTTLCGVQKLFTALGFYFKSSFVSWGGFYYSTYIWLFNVVLV